jgi:hypothetical protein
VLATVIGRRGRDRNKSRKAEAGAKPAGAAKAR